MADINPFHAEIEPATIATVQARRWMAMSIGMGKMIFKSAICFAIVPTAAESKDVRADLNGSIFEIIFNNFISNMGLKL